MVYQQHKEQSLSVNRKVERPEKEKRLREKPGDDAYEWAYNVQKQPFPSWHDAFQYAYQLGYDKGYSKGHEDAEEDAHWDAIASETRACAIGDK